MGAFETFVNANLGIRKPLISDLGHPSGSLKAAGVVGSQYINSEQNALYEKTGENNSLDWKFIRNLGDSSESSLVSVSGALDQKIDSISNSTFSSSLNVPSGVGSISLDYLSIGAQAQYTDAQICVSIRSESMPQSFYSYSVYNVTNTGFNVAFSSDIQESDLKLDVIINGETN
jgi:hypothetical protein